MWDWWAKLWGLTPDAPPVVVPVDARNDVHAVLLGLTKYRFLTPDLPGPVEDARDMYDLLTRTYNVNPRNIVMLLDKDATWSNKYDAINRMIPKLGPGMHGVVYQAGHGTQAPNTDGTEADGMDELCCMYDFDWYNLLSWWMDGEYARLFKPLHPQAYLTAIHDTCHSGTMTRNPGPSLTRFVAPPVDVAIDWPTRDLPVRHLGVREDGEPQRHVSAGACRDDETAKGFYSPKYPNVRGVFTWSLTDALRREPLASWERIFDKLTPFCMSKGQRPVLGGMPSLTARAPFQRD